MLAETIKEILDLAANDETDWCATIELKEDPDKWAQITWAQLNLHYPSHRAPESYLPEMGVSYADCLEISCWKENLYLTLDHNGKSIEQINDFLRAYFLNILQVPYDMMFFNKSMEEL